MARVILYLCDHAPGFRCYAYQWRKHNDGRPPFTSTPSATGALTAGTQTLNVGATLNVAAAQASGIYVSGTPFTVTVVYN